MQKISLFLPGTLACESRNESLVVVFFSDFANSNNCCRYPCNIVARLGIHVLHGVGWFCINVWMDMRLCSCYVYHLQDKEIEEYDNRTKK